MTFTRIIPTPTHRLELSAGQSATVVWPCKKGPLQDSCICSQTFGAQSWRRETASSTHCWASAEASGIQHPTAAFPFLPSCGQGMGCVRSLGQGLCFSTVLQVLVFLELRPSTAPNSLVTSTLPLEDMDSKHPPAGACLPPTYHT